MRPDQAIALVVSRADNSDREWNISIENKKVVIDMLAIGRRIRGIRGFDLTQQVFAKQLGIAQTQPSKYEKGQSAPTVKLLLQLKTVSGERIDWILTGEESQHGR
jgi:DNA-binding transcriptional regulator YiaG